MGELASDTALPGRELPKVWRDVATRLIKEQGWSYRWRRKGGSAHPRVVPPSGGLGVALPTTVTDGDAGHRASYLTALKRAGAILDPQWAPPAEDTDDRPAEPAVDYQPIESPWTESEWLDMQRDSAVWWRERIAGPPPAPQPVSAAGRASAHLAELNARLAELVARQAPAVDFEDRRRNTAFSLREVRAFFRQGYTVEKVCRLTGWGAYWIADLAGPDGRYQESA